MSRVPDQNGVSQDDICRRYTILVGKASICDSGFGGDCDCFGIITVVLSVVGLETGTAKNVSLLKIQCLEREIRVIPPVAGNLRDTLCFGL